jgi:hypothetical protein
MEFYVFGEEVADYLGHQHRVAEIAADAPEEGMEYFFGRESGKLSIQS